MIVLLNKLKPTRNRVKKFVVWRAFFKIASVVVLASIPYKVSRLVSPKRGIKRALVISEM